MGRREEKYEPALEKKKIPVLTLDHKWHLLFGTANSNAVIERLEEQLTELLKRQGKLNTEGKEIKKLKKKLMDEIVPLVDELSTKQDASLEKKIEDNKRLITECNEKLEEYTEELMELPRKIDKTNHELMLATMDACYEKLQENTAEIEEIGNWITQMRIDLKKKIIRKQEKEQQNHDLYSYMHAVFGADVIDLFDLKYNPDEHHPVPPATKAPKEL